MSERILLVEDHALFAESLAGALRGRGHEVQALHVTGAAQLDDVIPTATDFVPSMVLLDLDLAGSDSVPLITPLNQLGSRVVMLTAETDRLRLARCVQAGAAGMLSKTLHFDQVVTAIDEVASGKPLLDGNERAELLRGLREAEASDAQRRAPFERLTSAEQEVLRLLTEGLSAAQIAERRVVSLATVRTQIHHILQQLGVASQVEAVVVAHRGGWFATNHQSS